MRGSRHLEREIREEEPGAGDAKQVGLGFVRRHVAAPPGGTDDEHGIQGERETAEDRDLRGAGRRDRRPQGLANEGRPREQGQRRAPEPECCQTTSASAHLMS